MNDRSVDSQIVISRAQERYVSWTVDLLVYTVVLNLFDEYVKGVVIDSFTISIFTALLLKMMLVALGGLEHRIIHYFQAKQSPWATAIGAALVFGTLFGGKLLILEVVDIVFGDHVELGHFVEIVALILTMMIARRLMDWLFKRLGTVGEAS